MAAAPKKSSRAKKADPAPAAVSLEEQVRDLTDMVRSLTAVVANLNQSAPVAQSAPVTPAAASAPLSSDLDDEDEEAQSELEEDSSAEVQSLLGAYDEAMQQDVEEANQLEPAADVETPHEVGEDDPEEGSRGPYRDFDPLDFEADLLEALATPEPIDWETFAEPEISHGPVLEDESLVRVMVDKHPAMITGIKSYNKENPPDFVVEDALWKVLAEQETHTQESPEAEPILLPGDSPFDQSLLDDLLMEAAASEGASYDEGEDDIPDWNVSAITRAPVPDEHSASHQADAVPTVRPAGELTATDEAKTAAPPALFIAALAFPIRIEDSKLICKVAKPFDDAALAELEAASMELVKEPYPIVEVVKALRATYSEPGETHARGDLLEGAAPRTDNWINQLLSWTGLKKAA